MKHFQNVTLVSHDGVKLKLLEVKFNQIAQTLPAIGKSLQIFDVKKKDPERSQMLQTLMISDDTNEDIHDVEGGS